MNDVLKSLNRERIWAAVLVIVAAGVIYLVQTRIASRPAPVAPVPALEVRDSTG
jgi:hypothetical protein